MSSRELVSSGFSILALESARAVGLDPARLVQQVGLQLANRDDPDASIPLEKFVALWTAIAEDPLGQGVGLQCLKTVRLSMGGAYGYAIRHAETVGHALSQMVRHGRIAGLSIVPRIFVGGGRLKVTRTWGPELCHNRPFVESAFASVLGIIHEITGTQPVPLEIRCQFSRPADAERSTQILGCEAFYGCDESLIAFPESVAHQAVASRDPTLFAIVDRYAQRLAGSPIETGTLVADVRAVVRAELANGEPSIACIARRMAMSARTLQRRLSDEGLTVTTLVDEVRRELSLDLLDNPRLGISDIAFMLGYAEVTSFQRAFRRWTGKRPASYRRRRVPLLNQPASS